MIKYGRLDKTSLFYVIILLVIIGMENKKIKQLLSMYDDFTRDIFMNAILEFEKTFDGRFLNSEEIVRLLITNISNGIKVYDNVDDKFDAVCSLESKEFKISSNVLEDKDYFNYVFFHEFIHAISYKMYNDIRFMGFYSLDKGEEYSFKSNAFNEAFTEYLTLKRNKMCNYKKQDGSLSGYDLGATEIELLIKIIGEDELINAYFNEPYELENILNKYNMNMDEIFYSIYVFEENDYEVFNLINKYGMRNVNNLNRIIDGERYLFYNFLDSFGEPTNEEEFNHKWNILLSERTMKYNFWDIDGIFRYGSLIDDAKKIGISKNNKLLKTIPKEKINKYSFLNDIFKLEDTNKILDKLSTIYHNDYKEYHLLLDDEFAILAYTFLDKIKNNYQLYDIEIYPRVYPYLKLENALISDVNFSKIECSEMKTKINIFNIKKNNYIECNYDDTIINKKSNILFELSYDKQSDLVDIDKNTYIVNDTTYNCTIIY